MDVKEQTPPAQCLSFVMVFLPLYNHPLVLSFVL